MESKLEWNNENSRNYVRRDYIVIDNNPYNPAFYLLFIITIVQIRMGNEQ